MEIDFDIPEMTGRLDAVYTIIASQKHKSINEWELLHTVLLKADKSSVNNINLNFNQPTFKSKLLIQEVMSFGDISYSNEIIDLYFVEIIERRLKDGFYCCCHLDDYYIPKKLQYNRYHYTHINLIYGFDGNCFYTFGYNAVGHLEKTKIPYSNIIMAYKTSNDKYLNFLKPNKEYELIVSEEHIKNMLICYLNPSIENKNNIQSIIDEPRTIGALYECNNVIGYDVNTMILARLADISLQKGIMNDIRTFQVLFEHKIYMLKRLEYLYEKELISKQLKNSYSEIPEDFKKVKNLALKYLLTNRVEIVGRVRTILASLFESERRIIDEVICHIT